MHRMLCLGALALAACRDGKPGDWLKGSDDDKFHRIETQLRGLDMTMVEVGYRYSELYFAGQDRNWEVAKYQAEKIRLTIQLGVERRPKRAASAELFLAEDLPPALAAVEKKDEKAFAGAFDRLRAGCMKCHVAEKVPFFIVELPEHRLSPIRAPR